MTTTLADMNERMANVEKNMTTNMARKETMVTMETHMNNIQTNMANMETRMANVERNMGIMGTKITNVERNVTDMKTDMEGKLEAVNNEVKGLKTTLFIYLLTLQPYIK
jgi:predicted  nucleic acid-binding Zn-ribbon protein